MNDAVAYLRVSTKGQLDGYGLDAQEAAVRRWAETNGYNVVHVFYERGVTGKQDLSDDDDDERDVIKSIINIGMRRAFVDMEDYMKAHDIKYCVIPELSRLARRMEVQEALIGRFRAADRIVLSVKEGGDVMADDSDPIRQAFRQFMGIINQLDRAMIVARMKAGRIAKARGGGKAVGQIPYGYTSVDGTLHVNPDEADVVRTIYDLRVTQRWSFQRIADHLNGRHVPTRNGGLWAKTTIHAICNNPVYHGRIVLRDGDHVTESTNAQLRIV